MSDVIFIYHLNVYVFNKVQNKKNMSNVRIPLVLDLNQFMNEELQESHGQNEYVLTACVYHFGLNLQSGFYTSKQNCLS